jgi:hypothetical protein
MAVLPVVGLLPEVAKARKDRSTYSFLVHPSGSPPRFATELQATLEHIQARWTPLGGWGQFDTVYFGLYTPGS